MNNFHLRNSMVHRTFFCFCIHLKQTTGIVGFWIWYWSDFPRSYTLRYKKWSTDKIPPQQIIRFFANSIYLKRVLELVKPAHCIYKSFTKPTALQGIRERNHTWAATENPYQSEILNEFFHIISHFVIPPILDAVLRYLLCSSTSNFSCCLTSNHQPGHHPHPSALN